MRLKRLWQIGVVALVAAVLMWMYQVYIPKSLSGDGIVVTIPKGTLPRGVGRILYRHGVIRSASVFYWYVRMTGDGELLRAGTFLIRPTHSMPQVIQLLQQSSGAHRLVKITIPEGYNLWEMAKVVESKGISDWESVSRYWHSQAKQDFQETFPFLKGIPVKTIEGYLYPDTYYISETDTVKTLTHAMLTQFQKRMLPLWEQDPALKGSPKARFNFHQVLTIGSLIEKEARVADEMSTISAVFYNRLRKRMQLASDPTVVYAMGKSYKRRVYYKDTRIDSPYNTYKYTGFMPSPISTVSAKAFQASLNPANVPFLFFVANKDGTHIFTKTYRDHLRVQRK